MNERLAGIAKVYSAIAEIKRQSEIIADILEEHQNFGLIGPFPPPNFVVTRACETPPGEIAEDAIVDPRIVLSALADLQRRIRIIHDVCVTHGIRALPH